MEERYKLVGMGLSGIAWLFPIALEFVVLFILRRRGKRPIPPRIGLYAAPLFVSGAILAPPIEVFFIFIFGAAFIQIARSAPRKQAIPISIAGVLILSLFVGVMQSMHDEWMVLRSNEVEFRWIEKTETVDRQGLVVHETGHRRRWWETRPWSSWTTYSGEKLGPGITGFSWYWGPNGLIRGDDLGNHLAQWAETKPVYSIYR